MKLAKSQPHIMLKKSIANKKLKEKFRKKRKEKETIQIGNFQFNKGMLECGEHIHCENDLKKKLICYFLKNEKTKWETLISK